MKREKEHLFDRIARVYGLFFAYQKTKYSRLLDRIYREIDLLRCHDVIDFGCGTGALCSELHQRGFDVTGVDASVEMLDVAKKKLSGNSVRFVHADIVQGVPFQDKSFDVSVTSFVAHGLFPEERKALYQEMQRVTKHMILIYDYNERRSLFTNVMEGLEGGDYFNFIEVVKTELSQYFGNLRIIDMGDRSSCYVIQL